MSSNFEKRADGFIIVNPLDPLAQEFRHVHVEALALDGPCLELTIFQKAEVYATILKRAVVDADILMDWFRVPWIRVVAALGLLNHVDPGGSSYVPAQILVGIRGLASAVTPEIAVVYIVIVYEDEGGTVLCDIAERP